MADFFSIPLYLVIAIFDAFSVVLETLFYIVQGWFFFQLKVTPLGLFFFISVSVSFIFVAIKFIRSVVWGAKKNVR